MDLVSGKSWKSRVVAENQKPWKRDQASWLPVVWPWTSHSCFWVVSFSRLWAQVTWSIGDIRMMKICRDMYAQITIWTDTDPFLVYGSGACTLQSSGLWCHTQAWLSFMCLLPLLESQILLPTSPWRPEYACAAFTLEEENKAREMGSYFQNPDTKQACYTRLDAKGGRNRIPLVQVSFKMQISWRPVSVVQLAWNLEMREAGEAGGRFPFYLYLPAYLKDCSSTQIKQ